MTPNFCNLDYKQQSLIRSWLNRSQASSEDHYSRFMFAWIAFNGLCCAWYEKKANQMRPALSKPKSVKGIENCLEPLHGKITSDNNKIKIELMSSPENNQSPPLQIIVELVERYTENLIFDQFVADFKNTYKEWLTDKSFHCALTQFRDGIAKPNGGHYVVNLSRIDRYQELIDEGRGTKDDCFQNIIKRLDSIENLRQVKEALYQVRCNLFHGEKCPGEANDDRIVRLAYPVLLGIMERLIPA